MKQLATVTHKHGIAQLDSTKPGLIVCTRTNCNVERSMSMASVKNNGNGFWLAFDWSCTSFLTSGSETYDPE